MQDQFEKRSNYCPLECDSISYSTTSSFHWTESPLKNSTLKFKIYFKELKFIRISQQPQMNISDLISGIGGILGLFLGLSFLSFVEILEFTYQIVYYTFSICKNPNRISVIKIDEINSQRNKNSKIYHF
jgi:hypothetical protein